MVRKAIRTYSAIESSFHKLEEKELNLRDFYSPYDQDVRERLQQQESLSKLADHVRLML